MRRRVAIPFLLFVPTMASGCYGPCGAPIVLLPIAWLATPKQSDAPPPDPMPLKAHPASERPIDIRTPGASNKD
jgi:hypothetical protein